MWRRIPRRPPRPARGRSRASSLRYGRYDVPAGSRVHGLFVVRRRPGAVTLGPVRAHAHLLQGGPLPRDRVAISAAILVPLDAAQRRSVPVVHEGRWGGLRGLNPQPSEPQSDGYGPPSAQGWARGRPDCAMSAAASALDCFPWPQAAGVRWIMVAGLLHRRHRHPVAHARLQGENGRESRLSEKGWSYDAPGAGSLLQAFALADPQHGDGDGQSPC